MNMREQVLATAITCLPRPLPSLAPSIIPGKSRSYNKQQSNNMKLHSILEYSIDKKKIFQNLEKNQHQLHKIKDS